MTVSRNALIVDDERDIRELLVLTLGRMGLRCDTAASLTDARALLRQNRYALCLTDMRLADGSGVDLVREIAEGYPAALPVVATIYDDDLHLFPAIAAGALSVDWKGEAELAVATGDGVKEPLNRRSTISINF